MSEDRRTEAPPYRVGVSAVVAVAYIAFAQLGFAAAGEHEAVTAVWPASGVALAAVLLYGRRIWPGIAAGAFVASLVNGASLDLAAAITVGNTAAPLIAAALLRKAGLRLSIERLRDVVALVGIGGLGAMTVSATLGTLSLLVTGEPASVRTWAVWWMGDAAGVVVVSPFILTLFTNDGLVARRWRQAVVLLGVLAAATTAAVLTDSLVGYAVIPLAMIVAVQLEQQGAAIAAVTLSVIDVTHLVATGPSLTLDTDLIALQGVNATIALILLALASVMNERRRAQSTLRDATAGLERRVAERTEALLRANERLEKEIEERRMTEEALRESEERLAKAQRLAHIGSFEWDASADRNDWSEELFRIYGLDPAGDPPGFEEYVGFVRNDVRMGVREAIEKGIAAGEPFSHEYPVALRDRTKKWVQAHLEPLLHPDGSVAGLRGTCQDITARKEAEAALRWSEGRFRALLESAPDAVIVVDPTGKIVLSNEQTTKILGYERDELLGQPVEMLLGDELRDAHVAHRQLYNAQPAKRPMGNGRDLFAIRKDGTRVAIDISLSPVETDSGFLVFALMRDASERRRVEDALRTALDREREATEDLRKLDRAKNSFLSAVSHELRTPLTSILGFAEMLEEPSVKESGEMTSDLIGRVRYSANRLNDLLGDLLDLDRLHRGIVEPRRRATSLRNLVPRALGGLDLGRHPLRIEVDDAVVQVDPAQTERIIENLVSNAVRYTPDGTDVFLRARALPNSGLDLVVEDEGPGVPKELWPTIFEPFVRGDTGTFTQGTGIGLSLVERFALLHGGSAEVAERRGGGAWFHVVLPGSHEAAATAVHAAVA